MVAIALETEHEETQDEAQVVVDGGKDHGRLGWSPTTRSRRRLTVDRILHRHRDQVIQQATSAWSR